MKESVKIIINADDLGASPEVDDAVYRLMSDERLTSATLIANGRSVEDATRRARDFPQCSFGVHLNVTAFRPLTNQPELKPLLDPDGCFKKGALRKTKLTRRLRAAIFRELSAQIQKIKDLGVPVSHFDSHHHVHTVPGLFGVLKQLQRRFGVRKVRLSMNLYSESPPPLLRAGKLLWNEALRHWYATLTTQAFTSLAVFGKLAGGLLNPPRSIELMTHPADHGCTDYSMLRREDLWQNLPFTVQLISYNQLLRGDDAGVTDR
jgi:chitin disaccharide deacetylase